MALKRKRDRAAAAGLSDDENGPIENDAENVFYDSFDDNNMKKKSLTNTLFPKNF